ncbi:MAG: ComEC/Rec2 family competence protein [Candidatus Nanopelagicales bacterium]
MKGRSGGVSASLSWRLVPGALLSWLVVWVLLLQIEHISPAAVAGAAALALLTAVLLSLGGVVRSEAGATRSGEVRRSAAATLLILAAALASTAAYVAGLTTGPVRDNIGRRVVADVSVVGDLRMRPGVTPWQAEPVLDARAHLSYLQVSGQEWEVGAPVLLRMPPETAPEVGALLRITGTLRDGDALRGFAATIAPTSVTQIEPPGLLGRIAGDVRRSLTAALEGGEPRAAALVAGLAVGDETVQPPELADQMRVSGLSHLTAVSGGNTALVVGAVVAVAALFGVGLVGRVGAAVLALGLFVVVVGLQPSVLRAAVMGFVALLAILAGGRRDALAGLAFAVVVLLIVSPGLAASWGFALSVWATAGLVLLAGPLAERLSGTSKRTRVVVSALALTAAAQIATAPLVAAFGNGLSLAAIPANLLAAPAVAPITILGLLAALVGLVWPTGAHLLAMLAEPPAAWIALVAQVSADLPLATLPWPGGWAGALLGLAASSALAYWIRRRRGRHERIHRGRVGVVLAMMLAGIVIFGLRLPDRTGWPPPNWVMIACDVGQGDAVVLRGDTGTVVVDAGPDPEAAAQCLDDLAVSRVDLLVLTHPHRDHVGGVPGVLNGRTIGAATISPLREPVDGARSVDGWLAGVPVEIASVGRTKDVGGIRLTTLWPGRIIRGPESAPNNASVVLLAEVRGIRILLFGDVETAAQVALRTTFTVQGVDVVKVPHHGSRLQDPALAAWTGARLAIISVGAGNGYGHPAPETLRQWESTGAVVARTDEVGDIAVVVEPALGFVTR